MNQHRMSYCFLTGSKLKTRFTWIVLQTLRGFCTSQNHHLIAGSTLSRVFWAEMSAASSLYDSLKLYWRIFPFCWPKNSVFLPEEVVNFLDNGTELCCAKVFVTLSKITSSPTVLQDALKAQATINKTDRTRLWRCKFGTSAWPH